MDDYMTAMNLAEKKLKTTKKNKRKTAVYLASKGFDEEIITEVLGLDGLWNV
ncbi:MAG: RecX family transcriptional regulator [Clostridiales bacterium]|nr:RecX family transcriptional regulator [Clostridiales bacterium]